MTTRISKRRVLSLAVTAFGFVCLMSGMAGAQSGGAPSAGQQAASNPLAEQQFKNIQVLKGVPADQVIPAMQFISSALGVECEFCHVQREFEKDDKRTKQTARNMMQMQMAINKENFGGRTQVTCNTCHRGAADPVGVPAIPEAAAAAAARPQPATESANAPEVNPDQVLAKYLQAVGGAEALNKINTLQMKGNVNFNGRQIPVDVFEKAPARRASVMHNQNGDSVTAFDGQSGWTGQGGRARDMAPGDAAAAKLDADLHLAADMHQLFSQFRVGPAEKIGDRDTVQLIASNRGQPPVRFFFDAQTGLLLREIRYVETPVGRNPSEVNYSDYRDVSGARLPFQWTVARPNGRFTVQIDQAQANVPVDDSKFAKPAAPAAPASGGGQKSPSQ